MGLDELLGIRVEEVSGDRMVAVCPVTPDLHQPYGLVHGGVYAALAETAASYDDQGRLVAHGRVRLINLTGMPG